VTYADDCARPKPLLLRDERSPHHKYPKSVSSLGPGATGQPVPSKQDRHNVLEGSAMCGVVRSPGTETNLQAAIALRELGPESPSLQSSGEGCYRWRMNWGCEPIEAPGVKVAACRDRAEG
jgi:hypothetical protein